MRYVQNPDILTPIMESSTRQEYVCVDFYDFIRCESEGTFFVLNKLRMENDPVLKDVDVSTIEYIATNYSRDKLFELCIQHTPYYLLVYLLPDASPDKLAEIYGTILTEWVSPLAYHSTRYTLILMNLLTAKFIKKIYIVKNKYSQEDLLFLREIFGEECNDKIVAVEGDYLQVIKEHLETTFFMIRNSKDLFDIINNKIPEYSIKDIEDKYFLISYTSCNLDYGIEDKPFKNQDIIDNISNVHIYTTYLYPINEDKENTVG